MSACNFILQEFSFVSYCISITTKLYSEPLLSHLTSSHSGCSNGGQSCGTDPYEAAGSEAVVQGADQLHSLCGAVGGLAVPVAGPGADALTGRALLGHVLVQLWDMQETAVWTLPHQGTHICHLLCIWSLVRFRKCSHPGFIISVCTRLLSFPHTPMETGDNIFLYLLDRSCFYATIWRRENQEAGGTGRATHQKL